MTLDESLYSQLHPHPPVKPAGGWGCETTSLHCSLEGPHPEAKFREPKKTPVHGAFLLLNILSSRVIRQLTETRDPDDVSEFLISRVFSPFGIRNDKPTTSLSPPQSASNSLPFLTPLLSQMDLVNSSAQRVLHALARVHHHFPIRLL